MKDINSVCIIGAGPSGVAAAKQLLKEDNFTIHIMEQGADVGGVWNYYPANDKEQACPVPHISPDVPLSKPIWRRGGLGSADNNFDSKIATFQSPLYEHLEANLPKMLMQHSDMAFEDKSQLFPTHEDIIKYLERYAEDVRHLINFETQALSVRRVPTSEKWSVTVQNLRTSTQQRRDYDAVIIASGHYTVPFVPDFPGLAEWQIQYPNVISHSCYYRAPDFYKDKKVLIIGSGPSAIDITSHIAPVCAALLVSRRSTFTSSTLPHNAKPLPGIAAFLPATSIHDRAIQFTDGSIEADIDALLFCTGYLYSYPFLSSAPVPSAPLITNGQRVHNLYEHMLYTADPSLAFMCLPWNIVPFPVAESQAAVIARLWSGRLEVPSMKAIEEWEEQTVKENGVEKEFHRLAPPKDVEYINRLFEWCRKASATRSAGDEGLVYWDGRMKWMRENVAGIKSAFAVKGEGRKDVTTLEVLGFNYEDASVNIH